MATRSFRRDGEEALRLFGEQPFDLVVLDVVLPRLDEAEVQATT